ncbi:hypothetical protein [Dactylosporangium cerinum]
MTFDNGSRRRRLGAVLREARSLPTVLLMAFCLLVGIPTTVGLTPHQELAIAGQELSVGARPPGFSLSGPAQLVQIGNTRIDIAPLQVFGPLRPQLTLGPIQRNAAAAAAVDPATGPHVRAAAMSAVGKGFLRWYGWATLGLLAFTLAATAVTGHIRVLATLRRQSRASCRQLSASQLWHRGAAQSLRMTAVAVTVTMLAWAGAGTLAYTGTVQGLHGVRSLADLVGARHLAPMPVGPKVTGYTGAVIGDSRAARVGAPRSPTPPRTTPPAGAARTPSPTRSAGCRVRACATWPAPARPFRVACSVRRCGADGRSPVRSGCCSRCGG